MEVGIEATVRHAADMGYIPVIVRDACGAGMRKQGSGRSRLSSMRVMRYSRMWRRSARCGADRGSSGEKRARRSPRRAERGGGRGVGRLVREFRPVVGEMGERVSRRSGRVEEV
jgi:hypothetical protein